VPDPQDPLHIRLLIGGTGAVRFGVDLDTIGRVLEHGELPDRYRSVNVPRLLGTVEADRQGDRYAEVPASGEDAHVRLGPATTVEPVAADRIEPVPRILDRTAARWGWCGLWKEEEQVVVVLDAGRLSTIGAASTRGATR